MQRAVRWGDSWAAHWDPPKGDPTAERSADPMVWRWADYWEREKAVGWAEWSVQLRVACWARLMVARSDAHLVAPTAECSDKLWAVRRAGYWDSPSVGSSVAGSADAMAGLTGENSALSSAGK